MKTADWSTGRIAVVGAGGMLGQAMLHALHDRYGESQVVAWYKADVDVRDAACVASAIVGTRPSLVINASGYTNVDGCESHANDAMAVNAQGPRHLAEACLQAGAFLVHYSSDFVFDGTATRPYLPDDMGNSLSVYGRSKWEGERAICDSGCRHLIIRTSWLFGVGGRNFVEAIIDRAEDGQQLKVVHDQVGRPTCTADLVEATLRLLNAGATGIHHFANSGECSWYEFARAIIEEIGLDAQVQGITSAQLSRPARRPAYSVLDTDSYTSLTGHKPTSWRDALKRYVEERKQGVSARRGGACQVAKAVVATGHLAGRPS